MNNYTQRLQKIEDILRKKLPENYGETWKKTVFGFLPESVVDSHLEPLVSPCRELLCLGGKRWRPLLLVLCSELFCDTDTAYEIVPLVEFVHTASLIHDDIEDCADMRRGKPSAYITWGLDTALNAGSWLYFNAFSVIDTLNVDISLKLKLYEIVSLELRRLHLGQAMDIAWHRNNMFVPAQSEYEAMVRMKTGTLASLAAKIGVIAGGASSEQADELGTIAADIGVGFQIVDDIINLKTGNPGKKRGDDIVEGKKSLPVILCLKKSPEKFDEIMSCFSNARKYGIDSPDVEKCIEIIMKSGAVDEAASYAERLIKTSCEKICNLYSGKDSSKLISDLFLSMMHL